MNSKEEGIKEAPKLNQIMATMKALLALCARMTRGRATSLDIENPNFWKERLNELMMEWTRALPVSPPHSYPHLVVDMN
jgi:hypothetical protein